MAGLDVYRSPVPTDFGGAVPGRPSRIGDPPIPNPNNGLDFSALLVAHGGLATPTIPNPTRTRSLASMSGDDGQRLGKCGVMTVKVDADAELPTREWWTGANTLNSLCGVTYPIGKTYWAKWFLPFDAGKTANVQVLAKNKLGLPAVGANVAWQFAKPRPDGSGGVVIDCDSGVAIVGPSGTVTIPILGDPTPLEGDVPGRGHVKWWAGFFNCQLMRGVGLVELAKSGLNQDTPGAVIGWTRPA